ncbi:hypothetical protein [Noviherbaspirillum sp. Root189]|uniref:hypothetical protein n=1 Tax=Noviherbaspirillum sp. Root189 TaxID=1736487 RepID=UPI00070FBB3E|nr:hypothetical protein [Noviherbaspirillum sp. Root189]KRB84811.1 hypothetical protein ASE07_22275 [Noviherbaspirillum sp. Root189]
MIISDQFKALMEEFRKATEEELEAINSVIPAAELGMAQAMEATKHMEEVHDRKMHLYTQLQSLNPSE